MNNFKTESLGDIRHTQVAHRLTDAIANNTLPPQASLVFAYIGVNSIPGKLEANISHSDIHKAFGYSVKNIRETLGCLESKGFIKINRRTGSRGANKYSIIKAKNEKFERHTKLFVFSNDITTKEKEFLIIISPFVWAEDSTLPDSAEVVSKNTGLSKATVARRIADLKNKGIIKPITGGRKLVDLHKVQISGGLSAVDALNEARNQISILMDDNAKKDSRVSDLERMVDELRVTIKQLRLR